MSRTESKPGAGETGTRTRGDGWSPAAAARRSVSRGKRYVRSAERTEVATALGAVASVVAGVRSLRRGDRTGGLLRLGFGTALGVATLARRRSTRSSTPSDGEAGTTIPIEDGEQRAPPEEEVETGTHAPETATQLHIPERESPRRLGSAAFNEYSNRLPMPQHVFDTGLLALGAEVFWGVREADDAVLVSQLYDPIQDGAGLRFVGSTQVDDERMLSVPDVVLNHWDRVAGGGMAVTSGTRLVFITTDALREDSQLLVVPEEWAEELPEEGR
ncbi:hypothetical protein SAMN04487950_1581 [Halogranum rubrum]|uniref:Uncharacterized protein n=1 Tax=Halogranum rubrum TaxID=553466 RepID=A0A1I4D5H3_9EURY|nr:hypothetical protein [Halogranum rubrum]SFK87667.1 hypothetical protein SAMN04487950_1581 [Halogranum rubrum]